MLHRVVFTLTVLLVKSVLINLYETLSDHLDIRYFTEKFQMSLISEHLMNYNQQLRIIL
jgi:hypothetical protein